MAHSLKGGAGSIGATAVQHAALELELACAKGKGNEGVAEALQAVMAQLQPLLDQLKRFAVEAEAHLGERG